MLVCIYYIVMDNSTIWKIIDKYFHDNPQNLVRHHIESYNQFFKTGIFQIFKDKKPLTIKTKFNESLNEYQSQCTMYFGGKNGDKIYFGKPIIYDENNTHYMFPNEARLRNMTYGMTIHYDIDIEYVNILDENENPILVGPEELFTGGLQDKDIQFKNFKELDIDYADLEIEESKEFEDEIEGGAPKKRNKRKTDNISAEETAFIRDLTDKSMISKNKQVRNVTIEKVLLGRFPIMVQSDYCVLSGLPAEVRHTMGECRSDNGGYFIIRGKEKTVVSQEKFGDNMLYIRKSNDDTVLYSAEIKSVSENVSKPQRTLAVKIMAPTSSFTFKNIVVNIPNVRKPIPLFIVFRALGIISDKQIINTCLLDMEKYEHFIDLFIPSVHDSGSILTQRTALQYIASFTKGKTISHALEIMSDYFLPHIGELNYVDKAYYLGYITLRLLLVYSGIEEPTDRDNFKYKRIELVGSLMYDLFREYYSIQMREIHLGFESKLRFNRALYEDDLQKLIEHNYKSVFSEKIVEEGFRKGFNGNWGSQTHTKRIGIVQDLNRLSYNSALSHLRKTNLPLDAGVKLIGPRVLHSTQWGMFDPIDTPDGGNIGIHKSMSISAYITQGYSRVPIIKWLREKVEMKLLEESTPIVLSRKTKVIINGAWVGIVDNPNETVDKIRLFRRNALIPIYTSVTFEISQNTIYIYTDAGRICRPIFYRDLDTNEMSYDKKNIKKYLDDNEFTWNNLISGFNRKADENFNPNNYKIYELSELYENIDSETNPAKLKRFLDDKAIIDYIDTNETENTLIAINTEALENDKNKKHTHMEIHESLILGNMSNIINFPENNPGTRNLFSCGQSKQACSVYHTNYQVRMDKTAVVLSSGQIPLVKSRYQEYINNEQNPYGENTIVAIMCYTGYNVEDAILINEGALKRGLFQTTYYSTYESHEEKNVKGDDGSDKLFSNIESEIDIVNTKPGYDYSKLDKHGLIRENTPINDKTVLIGLTSKDTKGRVDDMSKTPKKGQLGVVDKSFITDNDEGKRIAKIRVREVRIPNIGDKMASRAGQKGTVGLVIPERDMPFTKDGIRPDLIINPHAIPSRMTIGHLVECIIGKASAQYGGFGDCTAFNNKGSKIKVFGNMLSNVGYHSSGNEILYNGMTGEQIETEIFIGPNYYMRLKHMVKDKINYRSTGPNTQLTRQPVSGRANDGGLRIGEMERDVVISHGSSEFLRESMMERGDSYYMGVCNKTGMMAIYNPSNNLFLSPMADGPLQYTGSLDGNSLNIKHISKFGRDFSIVNVPYSFKLLLQELQCINVQMRIITEDNIDQLESMSYSKNMEQLTHKTNITSSDIINMTNKNITKTKVAEKNIIKEKSPDSPAYDPNAPDSPNFAPNVEDSPAYDPSTPDTPGYSPEYDPSTPDTPGYSPNTPVYDPNAPDSPEFAPFSPANVSNAPDSPDFPPPNKNTIIAEKPELNELSKLAQTYSVGDKVFYRGDKMPGREWTVTNIGDTYLKIETNTVSKTGGDTILLVTAMDIYKATDYNSSLSSSDNTPPPPPPLDSLDSNNSINGGSNMPMFTGGYPNTQPPINIKIINGGNDYSSGDPQPNDNVEPEESNNTPIFNPPVENTPEIKNNTPVNDNSGKIDWANFDKLNIIKKD